VNDKLKIRDKGHMGHISPRMTEKSFKKHGISKSLGGSEKSEDSCNRYDDYHVSFADDKNNGK
jgi:hypothetical protein